MPRWLVALRGGALLAGKIVLPIVLLVAVAVGVLYVRVLNGPVALGFLTKPIEQGISAELSGFNVSIAQTVVALKGHSFEFQLKDIRLKNEAGRSVAYAPLAAVEISRSAFLRGLISPSRIVLIEPRMLVFYSPDGGVSLSIAGNRSDGGPAAAVRRTKLRAGQGQAAVTLPADNGGPGTAETGRIDVAKTIASLAKRARKSEDASSYLDRVGLRNATVILDNNGARTALRVPIAEFSLAHSDVRSVLAGNVAVASQRGVWSVALRVEDSEQTNRVRVTAAVKDLFPQAIADAVPGLAALNSFQFPISAKADYVLSAEGKIIANAFDIALGSGQLQLAWLGKDSPVLTSGRLRLVYRQGQKHFDVEPSTLSWAKSKITVVGRIEPRPASAGGGAWDFNLNSTGGRLAMTGRGEFARIKRWEARGTLLPAKGIINLDRVISEAGGGSMVMNGVLYTGTAPGMAIQGRFSPMSARNFLGFWPAYLARGARDWTANNVHAGRLTGGTFEMRLRSPTPQQRAAGQANSDYSMSLSADLADVRYSADERLPALFAPKASIRFKDDAFALLVPQSAFVLGDNRSFVVSDMSLETKGIYDPVVDGVAKFKVAGNVDEGLQIVRGLDAIEPGLVDKLGARVKGDIKGQFNIRLPFVRPGPLPPKSVDGQIRLLNGKAKDVWRDLDVNGSNVILDVTAGGLIARGEVRLEGVPVTLGWRRRFASPPGSQPPLRLKATLSAADRGKLGLPINHIVNGPMGIDISVDTNAGSAAGNVAQVRADLTKAEIAVESLAWRKPAGLRALLEFEVEAENRKGRRLANIRLDGDNVAIRGQAQVNTTGRLASFDVSDFAIDVVTRLQLKGELRKGNIWRVSVRGRSFEGRQFFRSLFSAKDTSSDPGNQKEPGLDLDVRVANVIGYWDQSLKEVRVDLSKRGGKMTALSAYGKFASGAHLRAVVVDKDGHRQLVAKSNDAGQVFKLVGFYPGVRSGDLESVIDLDSSKAGARSGLLFVRGFNVLGDEVVGEVLSQQYEASRARKKRQRQRQVIQFDWMRVPFLVGRGQFILRDAELRGPVMGVLMCGKSDFAKRRIQVAGTYIPLQGLYSVIGSIPGIGNLLAGPKGEGIIGINFEVRGAMDRPEVLVNPLSAVTPGIFREIFQVACPKSKLLRGSKAATKQRGKGRPRSANGWISESFQSSN